MKQKLCRQMVIPPCLGTCVLQLEEERAEAKLMNVLVKKKPGQDEEPEGNPDG